MNRRAKEIDDVYSLCERIGYGNVMDIAQALLAIKLNCNFKEELMLGYVITIESCIKKKEVEQVRKEIKLRIHEICNVIAANENEKRSRMELLKKHVEENKESAE